MRWSLFFGLLGLVFLGVFVGMQYGFIALAERCAASQPLPNCTISNCTAPPSGNCTTATDFSCAVGWTGVFTSVVAFGSFALPMKSPPVLQANVGPVAFQIYMSTAIVITSALVLITQEWSFTWYGTASAALWVPTSLLSQVAIKYIGISIGQSMVARTAFFSFFFSFS